MNRTQITSKYIAVAILLILTGATVKAQNLASAKILSQSGSVQISRPAGGVLSPVGLRSGDELFAGDVIKTGPDGRLIIGLRDGSQAIVSQNTIVEIKDANSSPRTIFNVLRGKTRLKIEKLGGRPNPYRVTTPTTVIAVRGTIFDVFVGREETRVFVMEGEVSVALLNFPEREVILTPGQMTRVKERQPPRPPVPFRLKQNDDVFSPTSGPRQRQGVFDDPARDNPGRRNMPDNIPGNNPNIPGNPRGNDRRGRP